MGSLRFTLAVIWLSLFFGFASSELHLFPSANAFFQQAKEGFVWFKDKITGELPWYYHDTERTTTVDVIDLEAMQPGLSLVTGIGPNNHPQASVIDAQGNVIHNWQLNWFELWPDATHIPQDLKPKQQPGPPIHGVMLMDNGDLIFNMEESGLFRLDLCGNIIWKLDRMTHHSLFLDDDGNLWVPGVDISYSMEDLPGYHKSYKDQKIFKVSTDGTLLKEWRLVDILKENNLESLLYSLASGEKTVFVGGDTIHLNDINVFSSDMLPGFFSAGDIMLSMRNIHTVLVLSKDMKVKHVFKGSFIRQHDPDFIDGNTISVFDNYTQTYDLKHPYSRILELRVGDITPIVRYQGTPEHPFFSAIMGKHERLDNGNLLITSSVEGRAFELSGEKIVWEYYNLLPNKLIGFIDQAQRLDVKFNREFFEQHSAICKNSSLKH